MSEYDIPHDTLKENAENRLNLRIGDRNTMETERATGTLWNVYIKTPSNEHQEGSFYHLRICSECGNTQEMNLEAVRRVNPTIWRRAKKSVKEEEIREYRENDKPPATGEQLKIEMRDWLELEWDNSKCEQRHPPRA